MNIQEVKELFEENYQVEIARDGIKKLHEHFARFDEDIIEEALICAIEQYEDAQEAFNKLGGICYNKQQQWFEEK